MRLYRGHVGAILIATLLNAAALLILLLVSGNVNSVGQFTIAMIFFAPPITASAFIGIVAMMIPIEAIVGRLSRRLAPVAAVVANCGLVWLLLLFMLDDTDLRRDALFAVVLGVPAAMLWLVTDRLYGKVFSDA